MLGKEPELGVFGVLGVTGLVGIVGEMGDGGSGGRGSAGGKLRRESSRRKVCELQGNVSFVNL